jgi:hypothetical protein
MAYRINFFKQTKSKNKEYTCKNCDNKFVPKHHGMNEIKFCSHKCANSYNIKRRERNPKPPRIKKCLQCGVDYSVDYKRGIKAFQNSKFCSLKCFSISQKSKDGLTPNQRFARKMGRTKKFTAEWYEKIKSRTITAMHRPDVQEKIRAKRSPLSEEHKMKVSETLKGIMPKNLSSTGNYGNVKMGEYLCSKGYVYFRSKWEANYALYLDFLIKNGDILKWDYEEDMFFFEEIKLGTRSYTPDFKVTNNDESVEYHEVKGYMDSRSKTKLKRMAKYYPDTKLILIDAVPYKSMISNLKGLIKFY